MGGILSHLASKRNNENGILYSSGLITGEAIMGILIALPIFLSGNTSWWLLQFITPLNILGFVLFTFIVNELYEINK